MAGIREINWELGLSLWALGLLDSAGVPDLAVRALENGLDSPSLRRLAGLDRADFESTRSLFLAALAELGVTPPPPPVAVERVARDVAEGIVGGAIDALEGARFLSAVSREMGPGFHDLDGFVYADSEAEDRPSDREMFADMIRREAGVLLARRPRS